MSIKLGGGSITSARIGSAQVSKLYLGSIEVWSATVLLLHFDGAFTDSSPNNLTITNTNAGISTSQSKFGGSSAYFDGSSYLQITPISSEFNMSVGDWTLEAWIYITTPNMYQSIFSVTGGFNAHLYNDNALYINDAITGNGGFVGGSWSANQWYHLAIVRKDGILTVYQNGTQIGSALPVPFGATSSNVFVGYAENGSAYFRGYIDEFRIIKGYAAYTSNFTPPSLPFGANETLLLHMDGSNGSTTFTDSSTYPKTVIVNGNTTISTSQDKFGGSSAYFDGQSLLRVPASVGQFGLEDFTIECWAYPTDTSIFGICGQRQGFSGGGYGFVLYFYQGSTYCVISTNGNNWDISQGGTDVVPLNQWSHIAFVRHGNKFTYYVNGQKSFDFTYAEPILYINEDFTIGAAGYGGQYANGYIDELRIIKGYAAYTSNFTPPISPF